MKCEHHEKYLELDGVDKTQWIEYSDHNRDSRLHSRHIPRNVIAAAHRRTDKYKKRMKESVELLCGSISLGNGWRVIENISYYNRTGAVYVTTYFRQNKPFAVPRNFIKAGRKTVTIVPITLEGLVTTGRNPAR